MLKFFFMFFIEGESNRNFVSFQWAFKRGDTNSQFILKGDGTALIKNKKTRHKGFTLNKDLKMCLNKLI